MAHPTIGDDWNDVEMIHRAGFGIAMGNAVEPAKRAAEVVVRSNAEGGVIDLASLPSTSISIRVNTDPGTVGSVIFDVDGVSGYQVENASNFQTLNSGGSGTTSVSFVVGA